MQAAKPHSANSTAIGITTRKVTVKQVEPTRGIATVSDIQGFSTDVLYRVQRVGRIPQQGEVWWIDRSLGVWTFLAYVSPDDASITNFAQGLTTATAITRTGQTWQTPTLGAGWAFGPSSGAHQALRYRIDAQDNLQFAGLVHSTSTTPTATLLNLPGGYLPAHDQRFSVNQNNSGTWAAGGVNITALGAVSVLPAVTAASTDVHIYGVIPMGTIA